jgi:argininosuccinate synthase
LKVIAPWREWKIKSREDAIDYAHQHNVPITATKQKNYSEDRNIWHISHEGGILENPASEAEESMWKLTVSPEKAPDQPRYVEIEFDQGTPVGVDGKRLAPVELLQTLNKIGGEHGVGRIDLVENRLVGMKSRGAYETPGGTLLVQAHRELESICLDKEVLRMKDQLALKYADLVYNGQWFTPIREALDAFVNSTQRTVTGSVRPQAVQGEHPRGRPEVGPLALPGRPGHLWRGGGVQPEGCGGIHQSLWFARKSAGAGKATVMRGA